MVQLFIMLLPIKGIDLMLALDWGQVLVAGLVKSATPFPIQRLVHQLCRAGLEWENGWGSL